MNFPKIAHVAAALPFAMIASWAVADAQSSGHPHFVPEPLSAFSQAYGSARRVPLDARHSDEKQYHAYHFASPGPAVVIAKSVTVDAEGHLHIKLEPGTTAHGRAASGGGETHILLPVTVTPPQ